MSHRYEVWRCAAKDDSRPQFKYVNIQEWRGHMVAVAADGFVLAVVPVTLEEGDVPGLLEARLLRHAGRVQHRQGRTGRIVRIRFENATHDRLQLEAKYPNIGSIIDRCHRYGEQMPTSPFAVQPRYLKRVARAIGAVLAPVITRLQYEAEDGQPKRGDPSFAPVLLTPTMPAADGWPEPPFGLIMPCDIHGDLNDFRGVME